MSKFRATATATIKVGLYKTLRVPFQFIFDSEDERTAPFTAKNLVSEATLAVKIDKVEEGAPFEADFFSIYEDGKEKYIHLHGYTYKSDDNDWRGIECSWLILPLAEFVNGFAERNVEYVDDLYEATKQYEGNLTNEEALNYIKGYYEGEGGVRLDFKDVTADTPCGHYYHNSDAPKTIVLEASFVEVVSSEAIDEQ